MHPSMPEWLQKNIDSGQTRLTEAARKEVATPGATERPRKAVKAPKGATWSITLSLPCVVKSEANERCHWAVRRKRFGAQAAALNSASLFLSWTDIAAETPLRVTWTHIGRTMDDDNLRGAFKGLRDALATFMGIDDADPRIKWAYEQRTGGKGVEVKIEKISEE